MRTRLVAAALILGLTVTLVSCGGGSSDSSSSDGDGDAATTAPASSDSGSDDGSDSSSGGDVDCAAIDDATQQLISVQLLAQLKDVATVEQIESNSVGSLDIDEFLAGMETLHQLDGYSNPLGDPKEAITLYEEAAAQAKELFDADPPTQEAIDAYQESIGGPAEFLSHQTAIAGARDEAGC